MGSSAASDDELAAAQAPGRRPTADDGRAASSLVRASTLTGRPVVTLAGEHDVEVKDVVFDKALGSITGFTLRRPGLLGGPQKHVLPIAGVHAIGPDAVMIEGPHVFADSDALAASGDDVIGDRVITDDGVELGTVRDVLATITPGAADITGFELGPTDAVAGDGPAFLPLPDALAISGEAVVVPARAREHLAGDEAGLAAATDALRRELSEEAR